MVYHRSLHSKRVKLPSREAHNYEPTSYTRIVNNFEDAEAAIYELRVANIDGFNFE